MQEVVPAVGAVVLALAQVHELYPDERFADAIEAYPAEGIDINEDGEYTERSHAIYGHVVDTHLIDAARSLDRPSLLDPVRRNLHTLVDFSNHDWTVETSVSRRQDYGERVVPVRGAPNFYYVTRRDDSLCRQMAASGVFEGREIAFEDGSATVTLERTFDDPDRAVLRQPGLELELGVERIENGLELHLRSEGGLAQVPFVVEARFPARGWFEFERSAVPVAADDPVFLGEETVTYHHDGDAITAGEWSGEVVATAGGDPPRPRIETPGHRDAPTRGAPRRTPRDGSPASPSY